jgi:hypothetical protein
MSQIGTAIAKILLGGKGYRESSPEEFKQKEKYIENIQQFYVSEHNINNFLNPKRAYRYGLYYFIETKNEGLQVRTGQY